MYNKELLNKKIPIWFMRQAGRYLPEYKEIRNKFHSFIELCLDAEYASEITIQPLKRFDIDAVIIFADILLIPYALGMNVDFIKDKGPILEKYDYKILKINTEKYNKVLNSIANTVKLTKEKLQKNEKYKNKKIIGFSGAPWTIACYMIEGRGCKDYFNTRKYMYENKKEFDNLIEILENSIIEYLSKQIEAGANIIKIFDSWAGIVPINQFQEYVINPTKRIIKELKNKYNNIEFIGFPKCQSVTMIKKYYEETNVDCIAIDQFTDMKWLLDNIKDIYIQGNLDNSILITNNKDKIIENINHILNLVYESKKTNKNIKFIFNTGHGLLPETNIKNIELVIDTIRKFEEKFYE